jgi:predicted ATPase
VLALLAILRARAAADCQFVIATHSPILMAEPGADIRLLEDGAIAPVAHADVEHGRLTRAFLDDPDRFLRHL